MINNRITLTRGKKMVYEPSKLKEYFAVEVKKENLDNIIFTMKTRDKRFQRIKLNKLPKEDCMILVSANRISLLEIKAIRDTYVNVHSTKKLNRNKIFVNNNLKFDSTTELDIIELNKVPKNQMTRINHKNDVGKMLYLETNNINFDIYYNKIVNELIEIDKDKRLYMLDNDCLVDIYIGDDNKMDINIIDTTNVNDIVSIGNETANINKISEVILSNENNLSLDFNILDEIFNMIARIDKHQINIESTFDTIMTRYKKLRYLAKTHKLNVTSFCILRLIEDRYMTKLENISVGEFASILDKYYASIGLHSPTYLVNYLNSPFINDITKSDALVKWVHDIYLGRPDDIDEEDLRLVKYMGIGSLSEFDNQLESGMLTLLINSVSNKLNLAGNNEFAKQCFSM